MPCFKILREKASDKLDELNDSVYEYQVIGEINGWLDLITGSDEQAYQNSLIPTSSHIFLSEDMSVEIETTDRIVDCKNIEYEITFVDNVMGLNDHYEIYCKRWT